MVVGQDNKRKNTMSPKLLVMVLALMGALVCTSSARKLVTGNQTRNGSPLNEEKTFSQSFPGIGVSIGSGGIGIGLGPAFGSGSGFGSGIGDLGGGGSGFGGGASGGGLGGRIP
ncbi:hypothetical protein SAY87_022852 [Trapa incisa]|uniref:Glycine-rich protein n=1 Tax=Trapa incisa TaxID=236973 RepID=A0AAN7Q4U6_9MYRT|nr:hypothetical protein SAY87_022852 [Trapa incisa]